MTLLLDTTTRTRNRLFGWVDHSYDNDHPPHPPLWITTLQIRVIFTSTTTPLIRIIQTNFFGNNLYGNQLLFGRIFHRLLSPRPLFQQQPKYSTMTTIPSYHRHLIFFPQHTVIRVNNHSIIKQQHKTTTTTNIEITTNDDDDIGVPIVDSFTAVSVMHNHMRVVGMLRVRMSTLLHNHRILLLFILLRTTTGKPNLLRRKFLLLLLRLRTNQVPILPYHPRTIPHPPLHAYVPRLRLPVLVLVLPPREVGRPNIWNK